MAWTEERIELLRKLRTDGLSFGLISRRLGVTRSAAIGKANRIGLSKVVPRYRDNSPWHSKHPRSNKTAKPKQQKPRIGRKLYGQGAALAAIGMTPDNYKSPPDILVVPESERKTLLQLEVGDCRYPYGEERFTFCGRTKAAGLPYCADHARACLSPVQPRELRIRPYLAPHGIGVDLAFPCLASGVSQ